MLGTCIEASILSSRNWGVTLSLPMCRANMDGLACSLHRPMVYSHQRGGLCRLTSTALSCHATVGGGAFPRSVKPRVWIFNVLLTVRVPVRLNLSWISLPLPGHAYPVSELS
jgi:hypothetical protein